jgi:hypothetical protein
MHSNLLITRILISEPYGTATLPPDGWRVSRDFDVAGCYGFSSSYAELAC